MTDEPDIAGGLDALQGDMAEHQRMFRGEVTGEQNRLLAVDAMSKLAAEWADRRPAPAPPAAPTSVASSDRAPDTVEKRQIDDRTYTLTKGKDTTAFRAPSDAELWFMQHAMPRVELLMTKHDRGPLGQPSWAERVLAVMAVQQFDATRYMMELVELLEDSNRLFGDWKADRARRIQVG